MTTKKFIVFCIFGGLIIFAYGLIHDSIKQWFKSETDYLDNFNGNVNSLKYILQWTRADIQPFVFMGVGRKGFVDRQCEFTNCVVTSRRDLLQDITKFDVIIFDGSVIVSAPILNKDLPSIRTPRQKYIFASMESAHNYPICSGRLDNFFNLSWTYRLDSDARWGYLLVKDINNVVIGPKRIMHWLSVQDMDPVGADYKQKLMSKSKAAAWFVSNCDDKSGRFAFAMELKYELKVYGLVLDIFGRCGTMTCSSGCDGMIAETYYFYLAFENSFSEDYVTEKLLRALNNDAVPVVFGGANYTR